jgi:two-component system chemotaxis response regulator CheY
MAEKKRILIVEDSSTTLALLREIVQRAGYEPLHASRGWIALDRLRKDGADLVFLDLMMKDMDGWSLLEEIKADERLAPIPVFIISARHPKEDPVAVEAHEHMFEEYYVKPFEVDALVNRLREILG